MALTFNSREAQDLISKHEQILKRLRAISVVPKAVSVANCTVGVTERFIILSNVTRKDAVLPIIGIGAKSSSQANAVLTCGGILSTLIVIDAVSLILPAKSDTLRL